jgi:hypothetical protein
MGNESEKKHRTAALEYRELGPDSLVGSFFHGSDSRQWQGVVVAEPAPGIYLVELFDWLIGASTEQVLVRIDEMMDWHFYDDAEWMHNAYEHSIEHQWKRINESNEPE